MKVLVGCEESQAVCIAFREQGHEAYSCDLQPCSGGHPEWHIQEDIFVVLNSFRFYTQDAREHFVNEWDMLICFPTCTYLTISANKWYKDQPPRKSGTLVGKERRIAREDAIDFTLSLFNCSIKRVAMENPIGVLSSVFRKPDQVLQPWMFGHGETKATCLWLKNLPLLKPTNVVSGREQRVHKLPKTKDRAMLRSKTYSGIATAMAKQWGNEEIINKKVKRYVQQSIF